MNGDILLLPDTDSASEIRLRLVWAELAIYHLLEILVPSF